MLIEKRLYEILKIVDSKKSVSVQELTELLQTSESTIRRDLTVLHNNGQLIKVHGGATTIGMHYATKEDDVSIRQDQNREEKIKIAQHAASLIEKNDFVYIDAGTTTQIMIDYITQTEAVFVTNATVHAKELVRRGCKTYILGGELKLATEAVVGVETIAALQKYNFTKGFWGTNGVCIKTGFTTPDISEALVKEKSMEQCKDRYVLCDSSKFNNLSPITFADFDSCRIITTNVKDKIYVNCNNIFQVN